MEWLTPELLTPIVSNLNTSVEILVPIGIGIMGTMIGVHLIPRIVYKFF